MSAGLCHQCAKNYYYESITVRTFSCTWGKETSRSWFPHLLRRISESYLFPWQTSLGRKGIGETRKSDDKKSTRSRIFSDELMDKELNLSHERRRRDASFMWSVSVKNETSSVTVKRLVCKKRQEGKINKENRLQWPTYFILACKKNHSVIPWIIHHWLYPTMSPTAWGGGGILTASWRGPGVCHTIIFSEN